MVNFYSKINCVLKSTFNEFANHISMLLCYANSQELLFGDQIETFPIYFVILEQ